ncbi:MAG: hypothetical protein ACYDHM_10855 [Acidiferrobacterales bacterium]
MSLAVRCWRQSPARRGTAAAAGWWLRGVTALVAVCSVSLLAGACSTVQVGRNFNVRSFASRVERGHTTEAQVRNWLGAPTSTGIVVQTDGKRFTRWLYYFGAGRLPRLSGAHLKMIEVQFDRRGIVRAYNWSR